MSFIVLCPQSQWDISHSQLFNNILFLHCFAAQPRLLLPYLWWLASPQFHAKQLWPGFERYLGMIFLISDGLIITLLLAAVENIFHSLHIPNLLPHSTLRWRLWFLCHSGDRWHSAIYHLYDVSKIKTKSIIWLSSAIIYLQRIFPADIF